MRLRVGDLDSGLRWRPFMEGIGAERIDLRRPAPGRCRHPARFEEALW
jgi:hypothetical protein